MTVMRYLLIVFGIVCAGLILLIIAAWEPELWGPGWQGRMLFGIPLLAAYIAFTLRRFAAQVPEEERVSFRSYRTSNMLLAALGAIMLFSYVWATLHNQP